MSNKADWFMTVKIRLRNVMEHDEMLAPLALMDAIAEEGGPMQVGIGWADADDWQLLNLEPAP